jgi:DNA-binding CsgD family transcriptional regulator
MFMDDVQMLRKSGMTDTQIAKGYGISRNQLQASYAIARNAERQAQINQVHAMREKGMSYTAIGERMGLNESSVRALDAPGAKEKIDIVQSTANMLRREVDAKGAIDVGTQVEADLPLSDNPAARIGITRTKMDTAIAMLREEGYNVHNVKVPQLTGKGRTETKVLAVPTKDPKKQWSDLVNNPDKIKTIQNRSDDGGRTWDGGPKPPLNISSKRIQVKYKEDGGSEKDGLIELRPGAKDLDLGKSRYAQVRIAVDKTHYLKGMAVYNKDLPPGVDIRYNTTKSKKDGKKAAMKEMEKGPDGKVDLIRPFGAEVTAQKGALNILRDEGAWDAYKVQLSSQMLSKQAPRLAKEQLDLTYERSRKDLDEIKSLTNPAVKKKLLEAYADKTDNSVVHLNAVGRVRQANKVLIPINSVKPHEIYAPTFRDGERVALVRHPHGGRFEIPELRVNNKNPEARRILGSNAKDAVGIHHKVAERLSGADFDGDHVLVIPNDKGQIKSQPALKELEGFDPRSSHPAYDGMRTIDGGRYNASTKRVEYGPKGPSNNMQNEMGRISNLISDMTLQNANNHEVARAVKHSMVVIDAEKHVLDYKGSAEANGIQQLKRKYQFNPETGKPGGAATLISRAKSPAYIPDRKPRPAKDGGPIDPKTGKKVFVETGKRRVVDGKEEIVTRRVPRISIEDDARRLVSTPGTDMERVYAVHANRLKAMANEARKEYVHTKPQRQSDSAKKVYSKEVESLDHKLRVAQKNAPLEREAQRLGHTIVAQRKRANPNMSESDIKKVERRALAEARARLRSKKEPVVLTRDEWNAIQSGAISNHKLEQILRHADIDKLREFALPRERRMMSSTKVARAKAMEAQGFTQAEIADALGVSLTTLKVGLE